MAGLNFVITADNKGMMQALQETQAAMRKTAQTVEDIGSLIDLQEFRDAATSVSDFANKFYEASQESVDSLSTMSQQFSQQASTIRKGLEEMLGSGSMEDVSGQLESYKRAVMDASSSAQTAYNVQSVAVATLVEELDSLTSAQEAAFSAGDNSTAQALQADIDSLTGTIDQAKDRLAQLGEQAVSANTALEGLDATFDQFGQGAQSIGTAFDGIKAKISETTEATKNWLTGNGKFTEGINTAKSALGEMGGAFAPAISGARKFLVALRAMIATPIGAVLTAIVLALKAMHTWFTRSADGQKAFAKVSAYIGSILNSLMDVVIDIGKYLFHAFADANKPLGAFARNLTGTFANAFRSVYHLVKGLGSSLASLGTIIKGIGTMSLDTISSGWERLKDAGSLMGQAFSEAGKAATNAFSAIINGAASVGDAVGTMWDSITSGNLGKAFNTAISKANDAMSLAGRQVEQTIALQEAQAKQAEIEKQIGEKYESLYKLKGKERQDAINELKELQKTKYDDVIKAQTQLYEIQKKNNSLHASTLEDLQKERDLRVQMLQTQAQQANATRMLARMEASTERSMASAAAKSSKATTQKTATVDPKKVEEANAAIAELERKQMDERVAQQVAMEERLNEARLAAMEEGAAKTAALRAADNKRELRELAQQKKAAMEAEYQRQKAEYEAQQKLAAARGEQTKPWEAAMIDQATMQQIASQYEELARLIQQKQSQAYAQEQANALRDFLKLYGDYEQQRLAITEEYAEKIAKAQTEGERQALRQQEQETLNNTAFARFKESINWDDVFGEIDALSLEHLNALNDQLVRLLDDATLSATDYKTVCDQINKVEQAIVDRQNEWKKAIGLTIPELERRKRLQQEAAKAQDEAAKAEERYKDAIEQVSKAQQAIKVTTGIKIDAKDINIDDAEKILANFDPNSTEWKMLRNMFDSLADAQANATKSANAYAKAQDKAAVATDKTKTTFADALNLISQVTDKINANISSAVDLIDTIGLSDTSFGKGFGDFAESAQAATGAIRDLMSGNYMGALNGALQSIGSLGNALGALGLSGFGESDKRLAEDIERLTKSNDALRNAIDDLTDEMSNAAVADAADIYKQLVADLEKSEANTQEMLRRTGAAYNSGFLGIGGSGSSNRKIDAGVAIAEWERVSKIVGRSVNSASQFWGLTSEQMYKVAKTAPEIYAHIKDLAGAGFRDAGVYMEEYIQYWKDLEAAEKAYFEKMTDTSLDSVVSDFKSALLDMDASASDFSQKFEDYLRNAIINALVTNQFEPLIRDWYEAFAKAVETDGIDEAEQKALKQQWDNITEQGLKMRDQLRDQFGWEDMTEGSGAYKAVSSFSQEQGDELNGRLTAIQIGQEMSNQSLIQGVTLLQELSVVVNANNGTLNEVRNILLLSNGHLEDIARYTKLTSQNSALLNDIATKLKTL